MTKLLEKLGLAVSRAPQKKSFFSLQKPKELNSTKSFNDDKDGVVEDYLPDCDCIVV